MKNFLGIQKGDWRAIAFCVIAAITFWFFNAMNDQYSIDVTHPLVIIYDKDQYVPVSAPPKKLRFSTTANGWDILAKTTFINTTPIEIELNDFKRKRYLTASRLKTIVTKQMSGIQINEVLEDTLYVNFEKLKRRKVRLLVDTKKISLADGYRMAGSVSVEPEEVVISGPASLMKDVPDNIYVTVGAKDISGSYDEEILLETGLDKRLKASADKVKVKMETYELEKLEKELKIVKVNFPKKKKIKLSEDRATVICYARKEDIELIAQEKLEAVIDYEKLNDRDKSIKVTLRKTPELVHKYKFFPANIKLTYSE